MVKLSSSIKNQVAMGEAENAIEKKIGRKFYLLLLA